MRSTGFVLERRNIQDGHAHSKLILMRSTFNGLFGDFKLYFHATIQAKAECFYQT